MLKPNEVHLIKTLLANYKYLISDLKIHARIDEAAKIVAREGLCSTARHLTKIPYKDAINEANDYYVEKIYVRSSGSIMYKFDDGSTLELTDEGLLITHPTGL